MRSMRKTIYERDGIRVNCVCPGMTESRMTTSIVGAFKEMGYAQTSDDVAKIILGIETTPDMNGKSVYVEGGEGSEFEDSLYELMPVWLGQKHADMLRKNWKLISEVRNISRTKVVGRADQWISGRDLEINQVVHHNS